MNFEKVLRGLYYLIPSSNENNFIYLSLNKTTEGNKIQDFIVVESSQYSCCRFIFVSESGFDSTNKNHKFE